MPLCTRIATSTTVAVGRGDVQAVAKQSQAEIATIRSLDDGDSVAVGGGADLVVLYPAGHIIGSICFTLRGDGPAAMLFTGNTLFIGVVRKMQALQLLQG